MLRPTSEDYWPGGMYMCIYCTCMFMKIPIHVPVHALHLYVYKHARTSQI